MLFLALPAAGAKVTPTDLDKLITEHDIRAAVRDTRNQAAALRIRATLEATGHADLAGALADRAAAAAKLDNTRGDANRTALLEHLQLTVRIGQLTGIPAV